MPEVIRTSPIVFFDGDCGLCQRSVLFILRREKDARLKFASLHSQTLEELGQHPEELPASVVLYEEGRLFLESEAAWRIARYLKFPFNLLRWVRILPLGLRDSLYRWVAGNRHKLFKNRVKCVLPQPGETGRFLP
ncbi:MAG: DCC1-like thiol-disulfide oxidoreductase family protein [Calditrichia bacterium]